MNLNLAHYLIGTRTVGPGFRAVLWTQGCKLRCPGCIAPDWQPFIPAIEKEPNQFASEILANPAVSGLTISGGEPMEQAPGLLILIRALLARRQINVICFTGYRLETILQIPPSAEAVELLDTIDVLIDGPYDRNQPGLEGLRGSTNQRFHYLGSKIAPGSLESWRRNLEVTITPTQASFSGVPLPGLVIPHLSS